ncbi:MAG: tRNA (N6-threonylcarbamoyladenosine(37)-N6)-methyltransferase TrmO [Methanoregula sp.]|jgi:tRNA-Thr(GGU) m(6)t(6)A37 methyltransferase TsaA
MQEPEKIPDLYQFVPIGIIHSPFSEPAGMPIQPAGASGVQGRIVLDPEFQDGLKDLTGFSRIILIYIFHRSNGYNLNIMPFLDTVQHGVFATRAPRRPNAIGISIVRLVAIHGCELIIEDVDILDGTPLLDIKPYVPAFDAYPEEKAGWFDNSGDTVTGVRSDNRFCEKNGHVRKDR